ncbi:MAG: hypothetical protein ACPH2K_04855, partial [Flavicella sp.]
RPLLPILEYYANQDYIVAVLCENRNKPAMDCNGKCYLAKELATFSSSTHQQHQEKQHLPQIDLSKYPVAPLQVAITIEGYVEAVSKLYWNYFKGVVQHEHESLFRPPILG